MNTIVRLAFLFLVSAMFFSGCATSRPPKTPKTHSAMCLIETTAQLAEGRRATRLPANYIWATLKDREQDAEINTAFDRALADDSCESKCALLRAL